MEIKRFIMLSSSKRGFLIMKEQVKFERGDRFTGGGCKKGSIMMSYADLERMFGQPQFEGKGDHITTEFVVNYEYLDSYGDLETGTFCLYDWGYGRNFGHPGEEIEWNIGGNTFMDGYTPLMAKELFQKTDIAYSLDQECLTTGKFIECVQGEYSE